MKPFLILHLSDAHIGVDEKDALTVLKPLQNRLKKDAVQFGKPDLIVFSGDLVFGAKKGLDPIAKQFERAKGVLDEIYKSVNAAPDTPLAIVPGNHDVNRTLIGPSADAAASLTQERIDAMSSDEYHWKIQTDRLRDFWRFVESEPRVKKWNWSEKWLSWNGTLTHHDKIIRIVGLNTSWNSTGKADRGNLWLGRDQRNDALNFGDENDFKILISHHPTSWLDQSEQSKFQAHIESHFQLHLHGHEHFGWFNDPTGHVRVAAGALYEAAHLPCCFSWITLHFDKERLQLHLRDFQPSTRSWVNMDLGPKAPEGVATLDSPWRKRLSDLSAPSNVASDFLVEKGVCPPFIEVRNGKDFCGILERHFIAETITPQNPQGPDLQCVYWPVRRRNPTIVHAAQAFIAAGLAAKGASVSLWIDEVGMPAHERQRNLLIMRLDRWFSKVPAVEKSLELHNFAELEESGAKATYDTFSRWLNDNEKRGLRKVLEISKIIRTANPDLKSILEGKPTRLMNPPLIWTGLVVSTTGTAHTNYATISGVDEKALWKAWRSVVPQDQKAVTHIFCANLVNANGEPYDLDQAHWDGAGAFADALKADKEQSDAQQFLRSGGMANWSYKYLFVLPSYLAGSDTSLKIKGRKIQNWEDIRPDDVDSLPDVLAKAIQPWLED